MAWWVSPGNAGGERVSVVPGCWEAPLEQKPSAPGRWCEQGLAVSWDWLCTCFVPWSSLSLQCKVLSSLKESVPINREQLSSDQNTKRKWNHPDCHLYFKLRIKSGFLTMAYQARWMSVFDPLPSQPWLALLPSRCQLLGSQKRLHAQGPLHLLITCRKHSVPTPLHGTQLPCRHHSPGLGDTQALCSCFRPAPWMLSAS